MTLAPPLSQLAAGADPTRVEQIDVDGTAFVVSYALELPDGDIRRFRLRIEPAASGTGVAVREATPGERLPPACPERHMNGDGTFCLGLRSADEPDLTTPEGVEQWWARLAGYLMLQVLAEATGTWPEKHAWLHGAAAEAQRELEQLCAREPWLRARVASGPIYATPAGRVANRRAPCPCGSGVETLRCHEEVIVRAAHLQKQMEAGEAEFYRRWSKPCCGTMRSCGVRSETDKGETR